MKNSGAPLLEQSSAALSDDKINFVATPQDVDARCAGAWYDRGGCTWLNNLVKDGTPFTQKSTKMSTFLFNVKSSRTLGHRFRHRVAISV